MQPQPTSSKSLTQSQCKDKLSVYIWGMVFDKQHKYFTPTKVKQLQNKNIVQVKSGGLFYLCRTKDGQIYGWGSTKNCKYGYSGQNTYIPRLINCIQPTPNPIKHKIKLVAAGNWHSLAVNQQGRVFGVGHNKYGSCGNGTFENLNQFTSCILPQNTEIFQISAGDGFSLMLNKQGQLFSCGFHERHGHKQKQNIKIPKKLSFQNKITCFSAGFTHSLAADQSGKVYSWGDGSFLQLGHGNKTNEKQPKQIKYFQTQNIQIIEVSCTRGQKYAHSMAVDKNGHLYTWGSGYKGKLGHFQQWNHSDPADQSIPKKVDLSFKVTKVIAGGIHSFVLNQNKQALSFGCGSDGRLGHEESKDHRYLYREGKPRKLETFNNFNVESLQCSYYHNICLARKK